MKEQPASSQPMSKRMVQQLQHNRLSMRFRKKGWCGYQVRIRLAWQRGKQSQWPMRRRLPQHRWLTFVLQLHVTSMQQSFWHSRNFIISLNLTIKVLTVNWLLKSNIKAGICSEVSFSLRLRYPTMLVVIYLFSTQGQSTLVESSFDTGNAFQSRWWRLVIYYTGVAFMHNSGIFIWT